MYNLYLLFLSLLFWSVQGQEIRGKVVKVQDGDTFTLLTSTNEQIKVRMYGIDAPEKKQPYGQASKKHLSDFIFGKTVCVVQKGKDKYKRYLGIAYLENGENVNYRMVADGYAWHFTKYSDDTYQVALEKNARNQKRGIWQEPAPVSPWDFRAMTKSKKSSLAPVR